MQRKEEIITFKVDHAFAGILRALPNRSEFIRHAVLRALENECPLCNGAGTLTPNQMEHWRQFITSHELVRCNDCDETYLACTQHDEKGIP